MNIVDKIQHQLQELNLMSSDFELPLAEKNQKHKNYELFLKQCETQIQKEYQDYEILVSHVLQENGVIFLTKVALLYKSQILYSLTTDCDYFKLSGLLHYVYERDTEISALSLTYPVEEKISFEQNPEKFQAITEDTLSDKIVANEMIVWKRAHSVEVSSSHIQQQMSSQENTLQFS